MSEEFSAGVQILLKRIESNPDEFQEHGKWEQITRAVFARSEGDRNDAWAVRALTDAEVKALHTGVIEIYRTKFDEFVMKQVLAEPEETLKYKATERFAHSWNDPRMLAQVNTSSGVTKVGGLLDAEPSPAFLQKIKKGLGL